MWRIMQSEKISIQSFGITNSARAKNTSQAF